MSLNIDDRFSTIEQFWQALNVDPSGLRVSEPNTALPAAFHVPVVLKRAVKRPAAVSVPKQSHAPRFRKPGASRSAVPKQPHVPHPGKLGGMSVVLLMLAIRVGAVLWSHTVGYHGSVSAAPTAVLLHKATHSKSTAVSTPSLTTLANLAGSYDGTIYDLSANVATRMSLTGFQQSQGTISGYFTGIHMNGTFRGIIDDSGHLQFTVTDSSSYITLSFEGGVQSDGDLSGNYCNIDQNGQCAGEYGIWSVAPAPAG